MSWLARTEIDGVIRATLEEREISFDEVGESAFVVRLMGNRRPAMAVRLVVGDQSLLVESFFVRRPDENAAEFYRFLLERNGRMYGVHFAIDSKGDVYLIGRLPLLAVTPVEIDRLLSCVLIYADEAVGAALEIGFAESVRREWDWQTPRYEPVDAHAFARFADPEAPPSGRHRRGA
ncbi:MAG TPA: YbjN domain-containing protein [Acidothermaceae bacterium]|nr:YbjN domain-containing protein [Acidothermaceae bacterium]